MSGAVSAPIPLMAALPAGFFQLPNLPYMVASFLHLLGLAVWLGGIVALGAIAAPVLFRRLPRPDAGALFGPMLRVFEKVSLGAAALTVAGAAGKAWIGGQHLNVWSAARMTALGAMVLLLAWAALSVHPAIRAVQEANPRVSELPEDAPPRVAFGRLHKRSERIMMAQLWFGLVVLFLA